MRKGFTLIELLAVIVVLAILALVVTPIVLNIVEKAQRGSDERSLEAYAKVVQSTFYELKIKDPSLTLEEYLNTVDTPSGVSLTYNGSKVVCSEKKVVETVSGTKTIELRNCMVDGRGPYDFINGSASKKDNSATSSTTKYTIKTTLTNATIDNSATTIKHGESYSATLTSTTEYRLDIVKITMDGKNITSSAYNNGKITINEVTGNVIITATAATTQFANDSWSTIIANVKSGNTSAYKVGDAKEITLTSTDPEIAGTYTVRIANMSTPEECSTEGFSQTACGFVIEFVDIIAKKQMNSTSTNVGGWPSSELYTYVNKDIYNALPSEIKAGIIDTYVVSGYGENDSPNKISIDKLYLLSTAEVWEQGTSNPIYKDTAIDATRQLDYYEGVTTIDNYSKAIKKYFFSNDTWWMRAAGSYDNYYFHGVNSIARCWTFITQDTHGVAPAFRIG